MEESTNLNLNPNPPADSTSKIVGAIVLAGVIIAGAILLKGNAQPGGTSVRNKVPVFTACLESGKFTEKVRSDMEDGNKMGVLGTPSSFILVNGKIIDNIPGAIDYDTVISKIESARSNDGGEGTVMLGRPISDLDYIIGSLNSKIIILEYSDLECPFCKMFHPTMQRVVSNNKDVAWVYRHYPIPQLHSKAIKEAEATECAADQGGNEAFWKFTDRIFQITPSNDRLDPLELPKIAEYIGLK